MATKYHIKLNNRQDSFYDEESKTHLTYYNPDTWVDTVTPAMYIALRAHTLVDLLGNIDLTGPATRVGDTTTFHLSSAEPITSDILVDEAVVAAAIQSSESEVVITPESVEGTEDAEEAEKPKKSRKGGAR